MQFAARIHKNCLSDTALHGQDSIEVENDLIVVLAILFFILDSASCLAATVAVCQHKEQRPATKKFPEASRHDKLGLVRLTMLTSSFPWATP